MNRNQKIIAGILALTGAYLVYRYFKKPPPTIGASTNAGDTKPQAPKVVYPLKRGAKGVEVTKLQEALGGKKNLPKFGADGKFGSETEAAVQKILGKKQVDSFEEVLKIANLNNLALDPKTGKFSTPSGGVTSKVSDVLRLK